MKYDPMAEDRITHTNLSYQRAIILLLLKISLQNFSCKTKAWCYKLNMSFMKFHPLTSCGPLGKKYKSILLKLVHFYFITCVCRSKIYYIHMYTSVTDLVNIFIYIY